MPNHGRRDRAVQGAVAVITPLGMAVPVAVVATHTAWTDAAFTLDSPHLHPHVITGPCPEPSYPVNKHAYAVETFSTSGINYAGGMKTLLARPPSHVYKAQSKNYLDEEEWLFTDKKKGKTWVEAGYTHGYWSAGDQNYQGAFWAYNPTSNQSKYHQSLLSSIAPYPTRASSWYSYSILEKSATQATFGIDVTVFSHGGGFKAGEVASTPNNNPHTVRAHSGEAGIETTCGFSVTASQWVSLNGQTVNVRSQGSWHAWPNYPTIGGYKNPMRVSWYSRGYTGQKLKVSESSG